MIFDAFARRLRGSHGWRKEQEHVARLAVERPQDTIAFAAVLDLELERRGFDPAVHAVRSSLLDLVCGLVHDDATQLAVHLASQPGLADPAAPAPGLRRARGAMQIAGTRPPAQVWELLADPDGLRQSDPEFGVLLLHELVVQGQPVPPAAAWCVDWACEAGHPLAHLPPRLLPIELGFPRWLPRYGRAIGAPPRPGAGLGEPVPLGSILAGLGPAVAVDRRRIGAAFHDWVQHAGGRVEIHGYAAGRGYPPELPAPRLDAGLGASSIRRDAGVEALFATAVGGGGYARGPGGAHARLRAWEAVSAILDCGWPVPVQQLADAAVATRWIEVAPDDPWFEAGAGHLWLIVEAADRLVVVAATGAG